LNGKEFHPILAPTSAPDPAPCSAALAQLRSPKVATTWPAVVLGRAADVMTVACSATDIETTASPLSPQGSSMTTAESSGRAATCVGNRFK
jgi:hypothetical protein